MSKGSEPIRRTIRAGRCSRADVRNDANRWSRIVAGLTLVPAVPLCLGLFVSHQKASFRCAAVGTVTRCRRTTAFQISFAAAQRWYVRAQAITAETLEALEKGDADAIHGSDAESYRQGFMARLPETGLARAAARAAAHRATTNAELYRATRLLLHIEDDLGHRRTALDQAKKLISLQPHKWEALMLLRAAEIKSETGAASVGPALSRLLGAHRPLSQ